MRIEPMHGDTELITPVHIRALDTLIASDEAYVDTHLWLEENLKAEQIAKWRDSAKRLEAVGAKTVVPGHRKPDSKSDNSIFAYTRSYLDKWEHALQSAKSAAELKAMLTDNGKKEVGFPFALERSVVAAYPK